jgi:membrane associated rhomboid family serine protease
MFKQVFTIISLDMEGEIKEKEKRPLIVTYLLLISTVFVQIYVSLINPSEALLIFEAYSLVPASLFRGIHVDSLVTYIFLHGNLLHLLVNSVALYGAGSIVERDIGHLRYFLVFLASGVLAGLMHCLISPWSDVPLVGSSGAIFGVIAMLFLLMPFKLTFIMIVPLPSVIVGIMLSLVELSAFYMANDIGIAHDVHLAGFLVGGVSAFIIDQKRALKGLIIATIVLALIYYAGIYLDLIPSAA